MRTTRLAMTAMLALSFAASGATTATATGDATPAANLDVATARFRQEMSLPADPVLIATLAADSRSNRTWSVPLTDAEAAEVSRRAALPEQASAALAWASAQPSYAGSYIDHAAGGVLVVQFADPNITAERLAVASRVATGATVEVRPASASLADLEVIRASVEADRGWFASISAELISTGIDTRNNALLIGVLGYSAAVDKEVRVRFGTHALVRDDDYSFADACTVNSCWPQKGGIKIYPTASTGTICTTGFTVRYGNPIQYGLLTAGHCVKVGGTGNWAHSSSHIIGTPTPHTYRSGASADAVVIKENSAAPPTSTLNYFVWEDDTLYAINRVAPHSEQVQGSPVCMQGWGTRDKSPATKGRQCGTITVPDTDRPSCLDPAKTNCVTMHHLYEMSFDTHPGDSGGPVSTGCCTADGLVTDSQKDSASANRSWYSTIIWAMSEIDNVTGGVRWRVCLNSTCTSYY